MCLGVPVRVISSQGLVAQCEGRNGGERVDLALVGELAAGSWVLSYLGAARRCLTVEEARRIDAALDALGEVAEGRALTDAQLAVFFPDLADREPQLPLHLRQTEPSA